MISWLGKQTISPLTQPVAAASYLLLWLTRKKPKSSPEKSSLYDEKKNFHVPLHAPYSFVVVILTLYEDGGDRGTLDRLYAACVK